MNAVVKPRLLLSDFKEARRKDKIIGVIVSFFIHLAVFGAATLVLVKPVEFAVDPGTSGIEIDLVAAPEEKIVEEIPPPPPEEVMPEMKEEVVEKIVPPPPKVEPKPLPKVEPKPIPKPVKPIAKDEVNFKSSGGAITEAKPDYLSNPAPPYPLKARQRGWHGTVLLSVRVDKTGKPLSIKLKKTSGHESLDEAAMNTVRDWRFKPGKLGTIPVESEVEVPVRFELK